MVKTLAARFLGACYAGLAAYCLLSVLFGPAGLFAYEELGRLQSNMEANLQNLQATNDELRAELESLQADPDRMAREARSLGFLAKDEQLIVLAGGSQALPAIQVPGPEASGEALAYVRPRSLSDQTIKEASLLMAGLLFLLGAVKSLLPQRASRSQRASRT